MKALAVVLLALPCWVEAHPLDEVMQGAYLTLAPGEVRLELDLTPGTKVAGALLKALDANADRTVTDTEAQGYARRVLTQSTLTLDGVAVSWTLDGVYVPPYQALEVGSGTISIHAVAERPDSSGAHTLGYQNSYQPAASRPTANGFLKPCDVWPYRVDGQQRSDSGRQLTVAYAVARQ